MPQKRPRRRAGGAERLLIGGVRNALFREPERIAQGRLKRGVARVRQQAGNGGQRRIDMGSDEGHDSFLRQNGV